MWAADVELGKICSLQAFAAEEVFFAEANLTI